MIQVNCSRLPGRHVPIWESVPELNLILEKVSSIFAVLAETDVINMVSREISAPNILKGIRLPMAERLAKLLRVKRSMME